MTFCWTWETFAEAAEKLTKEDGSQYGFTSPASFNQDGYYNLIYSMGGSVLSEDKTQSNWDSPETVKAMNWWYDNLVAKAMPTQQVMAENNCRQLARRPWSFRAPGWWLL